MNDAFEEVAGPASPPARTFEREEDGSVRYVDVDYRIEWDGNDTYRAIFQVTARLDDGSEETVGYTEEHTFNDEEEATQFAEGFVAELTDQ